MCTKLKHLFVMFICRKQFLLPNLWGRLPLLCRSLLNQGNRVFVFPWSYSFFINPYSYLMEVLVFHQLCGGWTMLGRWIVNKKIYLLNLLLHRWIFADSIWIFFSFCFLANSFFFFFFNKFTNFLTF